MLQRRPARIWATGFIVLGLGVSKTSADPRSGEQRQALRTQAAALTGAIVSDFPDYELVTSADRLTRYYFSKPGNPAYPFAITLRVEVGPAPGSDGCRDVSAPMSTSAEDASDAAYDAADRWMTSIEDGVMKEYANAKGR